MDCLVIAGLVAAGLLLFAIATLSRKEGELVVVSVSGKAAASFPLFTDRTFVIEGKDGGTNTLVIEDGYASIADADCPDKLCERMGRINSAGQSIICLPNEVVVTIEGGGNSPDAVVR